MAEITSEQTAQWTQGTLDDWAMEAFQVSVGDAYGNPPLSKTETQHLDSAYAARAEKDIAQQLSKAGVRLAFVLNKALGTRIPIRTYGEQKSRECERILVPIEEPM